jgi:hypothetical protein
VALAAIAVGAGAVIGSAHQVYVARMPRTFSPAQRRQIMAWEVAVRWRSLPAGTIFPASTTYPPPRVLADGGSLTLTTRRVGVAREATCQQATDPRAAAILDSSGCDVVLRATYADGTGTFVVTVGVAAFPGAAQAGVANRALAAAGPGRAGLTGPVAAGVRAASFAGTPASGFTDDRRQLAGSVRAGPYIVLYTIGYADGRPKVPVAMDAYTFAEMTSMAKGLAGRIAGTLSAQPPAPRCPGAPGC